MKYFLYVSGIFKSEEYHIPYLPDQKGLIGEEEVYIADDIGAVIHENRKGLKIAIKKLIRVPDGPNRYEEIETRQLDYRDSFIFNYEYEGKRDFLKFETKKFSNKKDFRDFLNHAGDARIETYFELKGNKRHARIYREKRYNFGREAANATSGMDPDLRAEYARGSDSEHDD